MSAYHKGCLLEIDNLIKKFKKKKELRLNTQTDLNHESKIPHQLKRRWGIFFGKLPRGRGEYEFADDRD